MGIPMSLDCMNGHGWGSMWNIVPRGTFGAISCNMHGDVDGGQSVSICLRALVKVAVWSGIRAAGQKHDLDQRAYDSMA